MLNYKEENMTKTITISTGSVRPNSVGEKLLPIVKEMLEARGATVQIANIRELELPFFNSETIPSDESYKVTDEKVKQWQSLISSADGVLMLTPEYNYQMTAPQKNAIDWLFGEWKDKPVATVSYGWGGGEKAAGYLKLLLEKLEAKPIDAATSLYFMKQLSPDGTVTDEEEVNARLGKTIDALIAAA